jgi:hypothetical protein
MAAPPSMAGIFPTNASCSKNAVALWVIKGKFGLRSHVAALLMFNYALPTMLRLDYNPKQDRLESCSQELQCVTHIHHFRTSLYRAPRGGLEYFEHIRRALLPLILFLPSYH